MSYRSDLEAARARADAAQREATRLQKELEALQKAPAAEVPLDMPIPQRFAVAREDGDVRVSWRWFKMQTLFTLFFVIAWDSFLVFWYAQALPSDDWIAVVFPIAHVAVGIGLTYSTLTGFLNRTTLRARGDTLTVSHGPLPWRGNVTLDCLQIRQLYVNETTRTDSDNGKKTYSYELCAMLADGREHTLVKALDQQSEAKYLEHVFERALGIKNAAVPGEAKSA